MSIVEHLRSLSPRELAEARRAPWLVVAWAMSAGEIDESEAQAAELLVRLYAEAPRTSGTPAKIPETLREIAAAGDASIDMQMSRLLSTDLEHLHRGLRWAVARVAQETRRPIDWDDLWDALRRWDEPGGQVRLEWAGGHWGDGRGRGRPPLSPDARRDVRRVFRVTRAEAEALDAAARAAGVDGADYMRDAALERAARDGYRPSR